MTRGAAERQAPRGLAAWTAPLVALILVALGLQHPRPEPLAGDVPATEFSSERAWQHLERIAALPHPVGSAAHAAVRSYLESELTELGLELEPQSSSFTRYGNEYPLHNVVARLRGRGGPDAGALLIGAHYDSVPEAPGAGDNGAAVASLLEVLRCLKSGEPLRNDVIAVFSDGEEYGLHGARLFATKHPWQEDVDLALNFDARGSTGPSLMFETSEAAGALVREYAAVAPYSASSSVMADIYALMPNSSDFTVYSRERGYAGLNFAFIGGVCNYHQTTDTIANLDRRSLNHHGTSMLATARHCGDLALPLPRDEELVWFNAIGSWLILYGRSWMWPLTAAAFLLLLIALDAGRQAGRLRLGRVAGGAGVVLGAAALSLVVGAGMAMGGLGLVDGYQWYPLLGVTNEDGVFFAALALAGVALTALILRQSRRWCRVEELTSGALLCWTAILVAASFWLPGASGLILWCAAPPVALLAKSYLDRKNTATRGPRIGTYLVFAAPALIALPPVIHLLFQGMTLALAPVGLPLVALLTALLWPVLYRVGGQLAAITGAGAIALWVHGAWNG